MRWSLLMVGFLAACASSAPQSPTPAVAASRVSAVYRNVVIVPHTSNRVVGDTVQLAAMLTAKDAEGEHSYSCGAAWRSLNPVVARFLHDGPDGRLVALAPGVVSITADCRDSHHGGDTVQGVVTLQFVGKP